MLVAQSCLTLFNPMDCSPPGSSAHGILQARILGWVATPFSRGLSQPRDRTPVSCIASRFFSVWATREALQQQHSAIIIHTSPLFFASLPSPHPTPLGHHRVMGSLCYMATSHQLSILPSVDTLGEGESRTDGESSLNIHTLPWLQV